MRHVIVLYSLMLGGLFLNDFTVAQVNNSAYQMMLEGIYEKSVPLLPVDSVYKNDKAYIILDTRSKEEYEVSHIKKARWVGYETFQPDFVADLPKDTTIIVYCSVGARSESIGEQLHKAGYKKVYNLYGGIFEWVNRGYPVYKEDSIVTQDIHPYSQTWGVWLNRGNKTYE